MIWTDLCLQCQGNHDEVIDDKIVNFRIVVCSQSLCKLFGESMCAIWGAQSITLINVAQRKMKSCPGKTGVPTKEKLAD